MSYALGMVSAAISLAYNFNKGYPLSAYGENVSLVIQDATIVLLILLFSSKMGVSFFFSALLFVGSLSYAMMGLCPPYILDGLKAASIPLFSVSRILQIRTCYVNQSTGQLSVVTQFLQFAGSAARVLTTMVETNDLMELAGFGLAVVLNGTLMLQLFLYRNNSLEAKSKKKANQKQK